jgi:hypothetical protein
MKKTYCAPKLTVHGSVKNLTQALNKKFGFSDRFVIVETVNNGPSTGS